MLYDYVLCAGWTGLTYLLAIAGGALWLGFFLLSFFLTLYLRLVF